MSDDDLIEMLLNRAGAWGANVKGLQEDIVWKALMDRLRERRPDAVDHGGDVERIASAIGEVLDRYVIFANAGNSPYQVFADANPRPNDDPVFVGNEEECIVYIRHLAARAVLEGERDAVIEIIKGFLNCPEIADCAPEDKDPETDAIERKARLWLKPPRLLGR